jgi:phenylacetaldehyde dehydrogenase
MKRLSLELGGKSPVVVLGDCPVPMAVEGAAGAIFFNHGQVCTAGSRLLVHRSIYAEVIDGLAGCQRHGAGRGARSRQPDGAAGFGQAARPRGRLRARRAGAGRAAGGGRRGPAGPASSIAPPSLPTVRPR